MIPEGKKFQFPSNGKAHSDTIKQDNNLHRCVFQFPSNGKAHSDGLQTSEPREVLRFNSLQTGRHIQTGAPS